MTDNLFKVNRTWEKVFIGAIIFALGCLSGISATLLSEKSIAKQLVAVQSGKIMDLDILHFKTGDIFQGFVISQDKGEVVFDYKGSTLRFEQDKIERIDFNYYTRYLKKVW